MTTQDKQARLSKALRENLKKRKQQERWRKDHPPESNESGLTKSKNSVSLEEGAGS